MRYLQRFGKDNGYGHLLSVLEPLLIVILALGLRLYHLGLPDLWMDELGQATTALRPFWKMLFGVQRHHGAVPLDYAITRLVVHLSRSAWVLRLPAALWGALSVYWLYRLGTLFASRRVGLMTAFLAAINVFLLRYSQELRFYSLFIFLTLLSTELAWRAWQKNDLRHWLYYGLSLLMLFYTHYFGALVAGFHGFWIVLMVGQEFADKEEDFGFAKQKLGRFLLTALIAALLFAPWAIYDLPREEGMPRAPAPVLSSGLIRDLLFIFSGRVPGWWLWDFFGILGLLVALRKHWPTGLFLLAMIIITPLAVIMIDQNNDYFFHPRQVIFLLPFYLFLTAWGVDVATRFLTRSDIIHRRLSARSIAFAVMGTMLLLTLPALKNYYEVRQVRREDVGFLPLTDVTAWRGAVGTIANNWQEGDCLVFCAIQDTASIRFYLPPALRKEGILASDLQALQDIYEQGHPVWVVYSGVINMRPDAEAIKKWLGQQEAIHLALPGKINLYFLQAGYDQKMLWKKRVSQFRLPEIASVLGSFANATRFLDPERALQYHEKAAALSHYTRPRWFYFVPTEYALPPTPPPKGITVTTRADYLKEAGYDAVLAGDFDRALADLNQAQALEPDDPEIAIRKGWALLKAGRPQEAVTALEHARDDLGGGSYWLFLFLGDAYNQSGQYQQAIDAYKQALSRHDDAHRLRFSIAESYRTLGDTKMARQWYQYYLEHDPDGPFAQQAREKLGDE